MTSANLDALLCYDVPQGPLTSADDRWTHADTSAAFIFSAATAGYTLEDLDTVSASLDALGFSLDSRVWQGGVPLLAAFDSADKLAFFDGDNMAATVETMDFQPIPNRNRRSEINEGIRILTDAANATAQVGKRENYSNSLSYGSATSMNSSGIAPCRSSGLLHRVRVAIAAGEDWNHLQGVEPVNPIQSGMR